MNFVLQPHISATFRRQDAVLQILVSARGLVSGGPRGAPGGPSPNSLRRQPGGAGAMSFVGMASGRQW